MTDGNQLLDEARKKALEANVKNLAGSTFWQVAIQIFTFTLLTLLDGYILRKLKLSNTFWRIGVSFLMLISTFILSVTWLSPYLWLIFPLLVCIYCAIFIVPTAKWQQPASKSVPLIVQNVYSLVTAHVRGGLLLLTGICILAVDFSPAIFPRSQAKTETWGYSLMDIGVAYFVLSQGLLSRAPSTGAVVRRTRSYLREVGPLLLLGGIRWATVKAANYQEHESEYGRHWNFFFTLAFVKLYRRMAGQYANPGTVTRATVAAIVTTVFHQIAVVRCLDLAGWVAALDSTPGLRDTFLNWDWRFNAVPGLGQLVAWSGYFLTANVEGVASLPGYIALFHWGLLLRNAILEGGKTHNIDRRVHSIVVIISLVSVMTGICCQLTNMSPSRRLCDAGYILYNVSLFFGQSAVIVMSTIRWQYTQSTSSEIYEQGLPHFIHRNSLSYFLICNVLTGLTNFLIDTLSSSMLMALFILWIYCTACVALVAVLERMTVGGIRLWLR